MMMERFVPLLAAAAIAVAVTILSTGGLPSPFASGTGGPSDADEGTAGRASASTTPTSADTEEAALRVHPLLPASLRPGGTRQLILQLSGPALLTMDADDHLEITFVLQEPHTGLWVRPDHKVVPRGSLMRTRFAIGLHADVACEAELGELHVAVRDLAEDGATAEATVALPPVTCTDPPPSSPETVHLTDPVCGEDWREEAEALKEGEELDPERCSEERWGEEPGSEPRPPPAPATPRASRPAEETSDGSEEAPEENEEPAEEPEEPPEAEEPPQAEEPPEEPEEAPEAPSSEEPADEPEAPAEEGSAEESAREESSNEAREAAGEESPSEE